MLRLMIVAALTLCAHCTTDGAPSDAGSRSPDAAFDAGTTRDASAEGPEMGAEAPDATPPDAAEPALDSSMDASQVDDPSDAALDASDSTDASDGADSDAGCESSLPPITVAPAYLSETGLYADIAAHTVASALHEFAPQFALWSDGAAKTRWIYLPECDVIDTSDPDHWSFPVGTRAFKEFAVDGKRIETRFVHRYGPGPDDILYSHYLWNDTETDAELITPETTLAELTNPRATDYIVPTPETCADCHGGPGGLPGGLPSRFLGFSAIGLSHAGPGVTLEALSESGALSHPIGAVTIPGTDVERAALGYLHANCGYCHNPTSDGVLLSPTAMSLMLETDDLTVEETGVYTTAVDVPVVGYAGGTCTHRLYPNDEDLSCIHERMSNRGNHRQMPPIDSHKIDPTGLAALEAFIGSL